MRGRLNGGTDLTGNLAKLSGRIKAPRDVRINPRIIACPCCPATVGEECITESGKRGTHAPRRRMAVRQRNNEALA